MALNVRHAVWLPAAPAPGIRVFALLYMLETFARASVATVIPIQAFDLLRDEQAVSFLYTGVALGALGFSLVIPLLINALTRKWVYTLGGLLLLAAAAALASHTVTGQIGGMVVRVMGTACLNVALNLYVLDHVRREDFVPYDSTRLAYATVGWTLAPYLGVWLYANAGIWAPFALSAGSAVLLLAVFWYLRLSATPIISKGPSRTATPLAFVGRFVAQPRLRLAWLIAFGRSSFWSTFFIYGPILMVATGKGQEAGGIIVSLGNVMLITTLWWGRLSARTGVRAITVFAFASSAAFLFVAGAVGSAAPWVTAGILLLATVFVVPLDAVGGVPFYRAVHRSERAEMASVYRSYMDFGELLPPLVYGVLLAFFGLGVVFVALGGLFVFCAAMSWRHLPRRL
jgi:MFS family permease